MPTVSEATTSGFLHCVDPFCGGAVQREAPVVVTTQAWTYFETGGSGSVPGIEKTAESVRPADASACCEVCQGPVDASTQKRPVYPRTRREWDPEGLLELIKNDAVKRADDASGVARAASDEVASLKAQVEELNKLVRTLATQGAPPPSEKRGPGRPRKNPEEED